MIANVRNVPYCPVPRWGNTLDSNVITLGAPVS